MLKAFFLIMFTLSSVVGIAQMGYVYGGSSDDYAKDMQTDSLGTFYICGYTYSSDINLDTNHGSDDAWLTKIDSTGTVLWSHNYGGLQSDRFNKILLQNGIIYCVGQTSSDSGDITRHYGNSDFWLVAVDAASGSIIFDSCYGGMQNQMATAIISLSNGHFIIGGSSNDSSGQISNHYGNYDYWIIEIDSVGNLLREKSFGGADIDLLYSLALLPNNELLIGGTTQNPGIAFSMYHGSIDGAVVCIDTNWTPRWKNCYGETNTDYIYDIKVRSLDTIILAGSSNSQSPSSFNQYDATVWQIDRIGGVTNISYYGGSKTDIFSSCTIESDSTYLLIGRSNSINEHCISNNGNYDVFAVRINLSHSLLGVANYGGSALDNGIKIISNRDSKVWVLANTYSTDGDIPLSLGQKDAWVFRDVIDKYSVDIFELPLLIKEDITIYPNPAFNTLYIKSETTIHSIEVFNAIGCRVLQFNCKSNSEKISISNLPKGIYLLRINNCAQAYHFIRM